MRLLVAILLLLIAAPAWAQQGQGMSQAVVVSSCGSGALPSGAVNQLTMDTTGRLCQSGIGSNVCPQATAYLARTTGGNEGGNAVAITALICGLVTDGVIDGTMAGTATCGTKLDALYVLAQQNQADALLNLCGTSYLLTPNIPVTFTSYKGYSFSGSGNLNTGFNPATATSPKFIQNSANFGFWSYAIVSENITQMGNSFANSGGSSIFDNFPGFYARVNENTAGNVPTTITKGLFAGERSSSASSIPYENGVAQATQTATSNTPDNSVFTIGFITGAGGATAQTICAAHIGGSLGATLNLALYNRLRTYMTAVGVP